jgi:hypothetical protein
MDLVYAERIRRRIKTDVRVSGRGSSETGTASFFNPEGQLDGKNVKVIPNIFPFIFCDYLI